MIGKLKYDDDEYELNAEFQATTIELSDVLEMNEEHAAILLLEATEAAQKLDRAPVATAVIGYHAYRTFLADSLRLLLKIVSDDRHDEGTRTKLRGRLAAIIKVSGESKLGSAYTQKCLSFMSDAERLLNRISEQIQKMITVGQVSSPAQDEVTGLQQQHLSLQHESLGGIVTYLIKLGYTSVEDVEKLLAQLRQLDRWSNLVVHYVPIAIGFFSIYGSAHGTVAHADSRSIHKMLIEALDSNAWPLRQLQGAITVWWLAEYNSWYSDSSDGHGATEDEDTDTEATIRKDALTRALGNGAFQCILSICTSMTSSDWYDPTRIGLITTLLNDAYVLPQESAAISPWLVQLTFEHLELFTFSFIQNMPDTLRSFKMHEEDQRRQYLNTLSMEIPNDVSEPEKHLEMFFVIMSYAYEGRPEAANAFWEDADSNLYGFLQWFSRRVSTPLVGAFCEMFRAISEGEEFANAAHAFLLEAGQAATSRARRMSCLSWEQVFEELIYYATKARDSPMAAAATLNYVASKPKSIDVDEPETPVMLESYLRLISHLCVQSETIRIWLLSQTRCNIIDTVFSLSSMSIQPRIRACAYGVLTGLLAGRTGIINSLVWTALDHWVSIGFPSTRPARVADNSKPSSTITFDTISADFEESSAFLDLLNALITPPHGSELCDSLCFPESLGSSYRMSGIDPYVDLVLGKILARKALSFDQLKSRILCSKIFDFIRVAFDSFNEKLLLLTEKTGQSLDDAIQASSLLVYVQLHPFSRVMEWMFNEKVLTVLFSVAHQDVSEISSALPSTPLNVALLGSVEVMNLIMQLQTTYLDIVRPLLKTQSASRRQPVSNPALASFEDAVSVHLQVITDLAYYAGTSHEELAIPSLRLLKQFSSSRKLNSTPTSKISSQILSNRLVGMLQANNDTDPISRAFGDLLDWDVREIEGGAESPRFRIKFVILDFIEEALKANAEAPGIAHALLGFQCSGSSIFVAADSAFARQTSLFHKIASLGVVYPCAIDGSLEYAFMNLKTKALNIVHILWTARLSSYLVLEALAELPFLGMLWQMTPQVENSTLWQGITYQDETFVFSDAIRVFDCFLRQRQFLYSHMATQLRLLQYEKSVAARTQLLAMAFGTGSAGGNDQQTSNIFDLLDFFEFDVSESIVNIPDTILGDPTLYVSCKATNADGSFRFELELLEQFLTLKMNNLLRTTANMDPGIRDRLINDKADILSYLNGLNNQEAAKMSRISALRSWSDLVIIIVQRCGLDVTERASFAVRALQVIQPKLVLLAGSKTPETHILGYLVSTLVGEVDLESKAVTAGRAGETARERLFDLFRICYGAISNPDTTIGLRESFYSVCCRYLTSITSENATHRTTTMQAIRSAGEPVIETISEDAYSAAGTSSIGALLLLDALARLATEDKSTYIIESLTHNNFIVVLIESISTILKELDRAAKAGKQTPSLTKNPHHPLTPPPLSRYPPPPNILQIQTLPNPNPLIHPPRRHKSILQRLLHRYPHLRPLDRRPRSRSRSGQSRGAIPILHSCSLCTAYRSGYSSHAGPAE